MSILSISEQESKIYGFKLARAKHHLEDFDEQVLLKEIAAGKYDINKLKISSTIENVFSRLDSIGIPYSLYTIIVRNCKEISEEDGLFETENFSFEQFDGSQKTIFINLVKDSVIYKTATNYHDSDLSILMPLDKELEALEQYNLLFNHRINKNLIAWLMKMNGEYIGFVTGEFSENSFEGVFYGVTKKHRGSRNYAKLIMGFLKKMCYQRGIRYFKNDVVFQNFPSLKSIMSESITPIETYLNLNLKSFFSYSVNEPKLSDFKIHKSSNVSKDVLKLSLESINDGFGLNRFSFRTAGEELVFSSYKLRISYPVNSEKEALIVSQILDKNEEIKAFSYTRVSKV